MAQEIIAFAGEGEIREALARADRGAVKFADFRLPVPAGQPSATFAQIAEHLRGQLPVKVEETVAPAAEPQKAKPARKVATRKAPVAKTPPVKVPDPAPVKVEPTVLRLVHDGVKQTSIYGTEPGSPAQLALGKKANGGLGWAFWFAGPCFYIPKSGGYAPDYRAINLAISRLESLTTDDGQPLYTVVSEIVTEVGGRKLSERMSPAEAAEWQKAYTGARNSLGWNLKIDTATCGKCGATGLGVKTGRLGKGADGMPLVECYTCGGFAAPEPQAAPEQATELNLSGLLVLSATAEPVPVKAAPRKTAARKAAPVAVAPVTVVETADESDDTTGSVVVKFALQGGISGSARNAIATEVRQALTRKITYGKAFRGVETETRRDKVNHRLVVTVTKGADGFDTAELTDAIVAAIKSVRGVGNRFHK